MSKTKKRLSAWLPSTPCTPEMREKLIEIATREERSLADLQRAAISLFLSASDGLTSEIVSKSSEQEPA